MHAANLQRILNGSKVIFLQFRYSAVFGNSLREFGISLHNTIHIAGTLGFQILASIQFPKRVIVQLTVHLHFVLSNGYQEGMLQSGPVLDYFAT